MITKTAVSVWFSYNFDWDVWARQARGAEKEALTSDDWGRIGRYIDAIRLDRLGQLTADERDAADAELRAHCSSDEVCAHLIRGVGEHLDYHAKKPTLSMRIKGWLFDLFLSGLWITANGVRWLVVLLVIALPLGGLAWLTIWSSPSKQMVELEVQDMLYACEPCNRFRVLAVHTAPRHELLGKDVDIKLRGEPLGPDYPYADADQQQTRYRIFGSVGWLGYTVHADSVQKLP
ncbi:hypothetical protein GCM10023185_02590 [Hymenobacter saemangeumensis]|uniref:DUF1707 domain-containing protein n=1 Tax=Hymenobacter saemangeumensis TaxID=1084522 RepID=A0ABP8HYF4_9BACT